MASSTRSLRALFAHPAFGQGARAIAGPALGTLALGPVTGVAMARSGLPLPAVLGMSFLVYASASQLACLPMLLAGAPLWVIVLTALMLNVRFVVFSAHWRRYFGLLPRPQRLWLAYLAGDPVYVRFMQRYPRRAPDQLAYFLGLALCNWAAWHVASLAGIFLADAIPAAWDLRFIGVLALLGSAMPMISDRPSWLVAAVAGAIGLLGQGWPFGLQVVAAIGAAMAAGRWAERRTAAA
ncbi:AzlC family ABC transporter permease [Variovorax ureilyticus]|uniref:AzlC family ABC transporter permease n=1 Tax=Variovorax ureilyticus TaxID=1836198 RepID=UPI003D668D4E